jgi:hypothetical protein
MRYICVHAITEIEKDEYFIGVFEVPEGTTPDEILTTNTDIIEFDPYKENDYYDVDINGKLSAPEFFFIEPAVGKAIHTREELVWGVCGYSIGVAILSICKNAKIE